VDRVLYAPRALPPLPPDVSQDPGPYAAWVRTREEHRARTTKAAAGPALSLIMVVTDADPAAIGRTLQALRRQTSGRWSLTAVTSEACLDQLRAVVRSSTSWLLRRRIRLVGAAAESAAHDLLWEGIGVTRGSPRALIFPGDIWAPDAVALLRGALTPSGVVYADEDEEWSNGSYAAPRLKPDFSPEFLLTTDYVGRPLAIGSRVADGLPRLVASGTVALEHECALAATESADVVTHIPEVLCHRSAGP
jgi:hypothetical protein